MKEGVSGRNTALILIACVVVLAGLKLAHQVVVPFMLAVFIATIASTPIQWLTRRKCPHWLAVVAVLMVLVVALFGLGLVFLQVVKEFQAEQTFYQDQIKDLTEETINPIITTLFPDSDLDFFAILDPSRVIPLASQALQSIGQLLSNTFLIFLTVLFILAEGQQLPRKLRSMLLERKLAVQWLDQFGENLNRYIAVKTGTSLLTGVLVTVLLLVLRVDFAILWGLLAFMLNYIPNIGSAIAAAPAILVTGRTAGVRARGDRTIRVCWNQCWYRSWYRTTISRSNLGSFDVGRISLIDLLGLDVRSGGYVVVGSVDDDSKTRIGGTRNYCLDRSFT